MADNKERPIPLKDLATIIAMDTGLVKKDVFGKYNTRKFFEFWELLALQVNVAAENGQDIWELFPYSCYYSTKNKKQ